MSLLSQLRPKSGSTHSDKRLGRGDSSGHGGTSTKGHKGQKARSGVRMKRGFEGGQMPLMRRTPKFGFNSRWPVKYHLVSLEQLNQFDQEVTPELLIKARVVRAPGPIKVLANGSLKKALTVKANKFSEKAKAAIESSGGKVEVIK